MADTLLIAGLIAVFIAVLVFVLKKGRVYLTKPVGKPARIDDAQRFSTCPLCGSKLVAGENLTSRVYSPETGEGTDKPCTIHGCPHCHPKPATPNIVRVCPVCEKIVPAQGYLLARVFYRYGKKEHVHVVGCSECHKKPLR
jgi:RNase P subunit RPR2